VFKKGYREDGGGPAAVADRHAATAAAASGDGGQPHGGSGPSAGRVAVGAHQGRAAAGKAAAGGAANDDDNIFDDVGTDYKPSVTGKKKAGQQQGDAVNQGQEGEDMEVDDGGGGGGFGAVGGVYGGDDPYAQQGVADAYQQQYGSYQDAAVAYQQQYAAYQQQAAMAAGGSGYGTDMFASAASEPRWRVRTRKAEERAVDYVDDAYGEYYPMAVRSCRVLVQEAVVWRAHTWASLWWL
jgi:hypothetical protein